VPPCHRLVSLASKALLLWKEWAWGRAKMLRKRGKLQPCSGTSGVTQGFLRNRVALGGFGRDDGFGY
jgi:hypothetical protein